MYTGAIHADIIIILKKEIRPRGLPREHHFSNCRIPGGAHRAKNLNQHLLKLNDHNIGVPVFVSLLTLGSSGLSSRCIRQTSSLFFPLKSIIIFTGRKTEGY